MLKHLLVAFLTLSSFSVFAQNKQIISGTIKDAATGETLIGATVRIRELPNSGAATNNYGFYSIAAPTGNITLIITYIG